MTVVMDHHPPSPCLVWPYTDEYQAGTVPIAVRAEFIPSPFGPSTRTSCVTRWPSWRGASRTSAHKGNAVFVGAS